MMLRYKCILSVTRCDPGWGTPLGTESISEVSITDKRELSSNDIPTVFLGTHDRKLVCATSHTRWSQELPDTSDLVWTEKSILPNMKASTHLFLVYDFFQNLNYGQREGARNYFAFISFSLLLLFLLPPPFFFFLFKQCSSGQPRACCVDQATQRVTCLSLPSARTKSRVSTTPGLSKTLSRDF